MYNNVDLFDLERFVIAQDTYDSYNIALKEMLEQMDETVNPSQKKEAFLFRFNKAKYEELKQKGFRLEF